MHEDWYRKEDPLILYKGDGYYRALSGILSIPFLPDFTRIPIIARHNSLLKRSLRIFIQTKVDEFTRRRFEPGMAIIGNWPVPLPSPVSNFLQRKFSNPNMSLEKILEHMRDEFYSIRRKIISLEDTIKRVESNGVEKGLDVIKKHLPIYSPLIKEKTLMK